MKHYISLGAGVQSSTMALMAAHGEITPMPDGAIFADTQAEPKAVYDWLDWLEERLPFPVHRVTAGSLTESVLTQRISAKGVIYFKTAIPFHTRSEAGDAGRIPHRTCTVDYKIRPITKALRRLAGVKRGEKSRVACSWIGISLDEMRRMKPSSEPWVETRWPIVEKRMTRNSCLDWMEAHGYPEPPRSACVYCPFKSAVEWRRLKMEDPEGWAAAVEFDSKARSLRETSSTNMKSSVFVHRSLVPLGEVDVRNDVDKGQLLLWQDECTGMCGV
jgi:hypothetical protein